MIWKESYRVEAHDTDMTGKLRAAAMMKYMQETAYRHMNGTGPTEEQLRTLGRAFLLSRIAINMRAALSHGDAFTVETYAEESRGISFGRSFAVRSGDITVAEAKSVWVLFDFGEHRILHVDGFEHSYGQEKPLEMELPRRISVPDGMTAEKLMPREVEYADIDVNGHVNNTVYADILCGRVPEIRSGESRVSYLYINYSNECKLGDTVSIERCGGRGEWFFRTHRDDGRLNVEARILTE